MRQPSDKDRNFVEYLEGLAPADAETNGAHLARGRAALAALRRGVGREPGENLEPYRYLAPWLASASWDEERAYYLIATLFATHRTSWPPNDSGPTERRHNLGASLSVLAAQLKDGEAESEQTPIDRRIVALLNCSREDLPHHLRQAVALLKSKDVPVDWLQLLKDVRRWDRRDSPVQRAWARAFWGNEGGGQHTDLPFAVEAADGDVLPIDDELNTL